MKRLLLVLLLVAATSSGAAEQQLLIDDFERGLDPAWESKSFRGLTSYQVVEDGGGHVLRAESVGTASGLICRREYDPRDYPVLRWRWKVANVINAGDETRKAGDDYAARVYVIFPHWFLPLTKSINYIWANRLPQGEAVLNPFTGNAIMVAVESGPGKIGAWQEERRDVVADYRRLFGGEPPGRAVVAVMTDTDQTGERAVAWYDDIRVEALGR